MAKDYYIILGVTKTSTEAEIKKAYRVLSKKYHPDVAGGDETKFKEASEAYSVLSDTNKKLMYDTGAAVNNNFDKNTSNDIWRDFAWAGSSNAGFDAYEAFGQQRGFGDNYRQIFEDYLKQSDEYYNGKKTRNNNDPFKRDGNGFVENLDININFEVTLEQIYKNDPLFVHYKRNVICSTCDGTGFDLSDDGSECLMCDSTGQLRSGINYTTCKYCRGSGRIHNTQCNTCRGNKVYSKEEKLPLNNIYSHKGIKTMMLANYGHFSKYYIDERKRGDLMLTVTEKHNSLYEKSQTNHDLYRTIQISLQIANTGGPFVFTHLDGKSYNINIPFQVQNGKSLKIPGKGLISQATKPEPTRGDLILKVMIIGIQM